MYYLCEKYYKLITVQNHKANCVSYVPGVNFVGLRRKSDLGMCSYLSLCWGLL